MNNQIRVLSQVLAIDAWHKPLRVDGGTSSVHVELSFHQGRLGGDNPDMPFTFRVRLKKALLTVSVEQPLEIDRESVARSIPPSSLEHTKILKLNEKAKQNASLLGKISPSALQIAAGASISSEVESTADEEYRFVRHIPNIIATPKPKGAREFSWELRPGQSETLEGEPWNPVEEPRLSVKSLLNQARLDPAIRVTVSCKFEDLEIDDLSLKGTGIIDIAKEALFNRMNEAAAIQQLKLTLRDAQLEFGDIDDKFSNLLIADMLASKQ
ncbi:hypothetical protein [Sphingomonas sp. OTU376]|uniref:hypothetical protein n=1 Tax=Sphingomonas sp. OTU376 TaxID=3043863 RepID=UPI00313D7464